MTTSLQPHRVTWIVLGLVLATLFLYFPLHSNGFIDGYDDFEYVVNNPHVNTRPTPANIMWAFTSFHAVNWHPLTWISHMLDCRLYGQNPGGHHLTNLLLHIANVLLLFALLRNMTGALWKSAIVAAVFAAHPLNVQNVAWVAERKELLSTFFGLLTVATYVEYAKSRRGWYFAASLLAYACALMSKQMLVTMPALLVLLDWWPLKRQQSATRHRSGTTISGQRSAGNLTDKVPFLAMAVCASVAVIAAQSAGGAVAPVEYLPVVMRIGNAAIAYVLYLGNFFAPIHLSIVYPYPESLSWMAVGLSAALLAGLTVVAAYLRRLQPWLLVGWLWFLGTLVPVIGFIQVGGQQMADRYMYVPMMGLLVAVVWTGSGRVRSWELGVRSGMRTSAAWQRSTVIAAGVCCASAWMIWLALLTRRELPYWHDSVSLFSRAVAVTERNYFARYNLGLAFAGAGRYAEAIDQYQASIAIKPTFDAVNNLGVALLKAGRPDGALEVFSEAEKIRPGNAEVYYNRGIALSDLDSIVAARQSLLRALTLKPDHCRAMSNMGLLCVRSGMLDSALVWFSRSVACDPSSPTSRLKRGKVYLDLGKYDFALGDYRTVLQSHPSDAELTGAIGSILQAAGNLDSAIAQYRRAVALAPGNQGLSRSLESALKKREERPGTR